ncbi:hypothetical protein EST38_g3430 [Candolleomyces aberdarensis]|uniref:Uncharacterized protein n=1 Tax=Candolleomyces aberdarensis TaxID=2316362 RepID=A0A4Q2DU54_9AGAR|nr:hypothetical protein EST38_g3430 [Candolleomyces aberdarensis]
MDHTRSIFKGLQEVALTVANSTDLNEPLRLFTVASNSLQRLDVTFYNRNEQDLELYSSLPEILTLSSVPRLTHLTLTNYPRSREQVNLDFAFPAGIVSLLSEYQGTLLEHVCLVIPWYKWDLEALWDQDGSWSRMRRVIIDDTGKPRDRFSRLKSFTVKVNVRRHGRNKWKGIFQDQAPVALEKARDLLDLRTSGISGGASFNVI